MKKFILLCLMLPGSIFTFAKNTVTKVEQVSTEVTLIDNVDYVITSTTPFTGDGLINIVNTDHAVVIFQNIKPSAVISGELYKKIQINGNTATTSSCQIRMYDRGTIIFPYSNASSSIAAYRPLTCYTKANFEGESYGNYFEGHDGNGYMKTLSETGLNNNIRSFKLKRGYMVTFAVGKSGWGYSRCFIADQEDLEISSLPYMLNGKITSYRLFRWWNAGKKQLADNLNETDLSALCVQSSYTWGVGHDMQPDYECVPNHIHENWPSVSDIGKATWSPHSKTNNEPRNPAESDGTWTMDQILGNWEGLMRTGMRLCSPSSWDGSDYWNATGFLADFMDVIDTRGWRCDIIDLHCYWAEGSFANIQNWTNKYKRPVWISEWCWGASWNNNGAFASGVTPEQVRDALQRICTKLNNNEYVERYYYWNGERYPSKLYDGSLTPAGVYYAAMDGGLGYKPSIQKIPTDQPLQNTMIADLKATYNTTTGNVTVNWTDGNYERIDSFVVQAKRPGSSNYTKVGVVYPADQNAKDGTTSELYSFIDNNAPAGGNSYRVVVRYSSSSFISNEATVGVASNRSIGSLRYGEINVSGTEKNTVNYAKAFKNLSIPNLVYSAPSANNKVGKFFIIRTTSSNSFGLQQMPYVKADGTAVSVTNAESACYIALPKDSTCYDLPNVLDGGNPLTLQCGQISQVGLTNVHVSFEKAYEEGVVPVVIVSPVVKSNAISYGLSARVENITNTGFDVRIQRQNYYHDISFSTIPVYFFAMQPGEASLGGGLLISAQRFEDALVGAAVGGNGKPVTLVTPLLNPYILLGAQSNKHDALREIFLFKTAKNGDTDNVVSFTPNAYLDATASTTGTAYSPSEDLGIIAIATDPNGNPEDDPTVTAIRSLEASGAAGEADFDAWIEGNVIRASKPGVHVFTAGGQQVMIGQPLPKGLYIVSDGTDSKKLIIE